MIRILPYSEWDRLRGPVKQCFGADKEPPPTQTAICAVEEDENGDIKGFLFLQLCAHLEPFGSLGGASFSKLREAIDVTLTNIPDSVYYLHADNAASIDIYTDKGFTPKGVLLEGRPKVT